MLAIFDRGAPAPPPRPFNLAAHVLGAASPPPDKIALAVLRLTGAERWSYGRLEAAVRGTAAGLLTAGLTPGQRVLMRLGNDVDFPVGFLGAIAAGLVPIPTSSQLTSPEIARLLPRLDPAAILHAPPVPIPETALPVFGPAEMRAWRDLPGADYAMGDPDRLAYIVLTSGTSGTPRTVGHAHRAVWARRMMTEGWYGLTSEDRLAHAGAFNWTYTLGTGLLDPWAAGATALIPAEGIAPEQLPLLLKRHEATIFAAAPGVYRKLLKAEKLDLPRLRHGLSAGEKLAEPIRADWEAATGTPIFEAYGMSECSTFISAAPGSPAPAGTLGRPQIGRRVAILGDAGPVDTGAPGQIAVAASDPGLMLGYMGDPDTTAEKFNGDWFLTGDLGAMDEDGAITYLGRADDMMNAGGYRVSPLEVEEALLSHPGIAEAGVTDIEIKPGVRIVAAFWSGPDDIAEADLAAWASARLARYKTPRLWRRLEALPRSPNGKLRRRALADYA